MYSMCLNMSKRKKHNPNQRAQNMLRIRMWSWESSVTDGDRDLYAEFRKGVSWLGLDQDTVAGIARRKNNWSLILRVITWYPDGKADIQPAIAHFPNSNLADLEEEAQNLRRIALEKIQTSHIVDVGWVAYSYINTPRTEGDADLLHLGEITPERQMLWNYETNEELKKEVACY